MGYNYEDAQGATGSATMLQSRAGALTKDMPLTVAIKDASANHIQTATRTHQTLSELRDRLLGSPPPSPMGTEGRGVEPFSFADAIQGANSELGQRLCALEGLAQELANRL